MVTHNAAQALPRTRTPAAASRASRKLAVLALCLWVCVMTACAPGARPPAAPSSSPAPAEPPATAEGFNTRLETLKNTPESQFMPRFAAAMQSNLGPDMVNADIPATGRKVAQYRWQAPNKAQPCIIRVQSQGGLVESFNTEGECVASMPSYALSPPAGLPASPLRASDLPPITNKPAETASQPKEDPLRTREGLKKKLQQFIGASDQYLLKTFRAGFPDVQARTLAIDITGDDATCTVIQWTADYHLRSAVPRVRTVESTVNGKAVNTTGTYYDMKKYQHQCVVRFFANGGRIVSFTLEGDGCVWQ